MKTGLWLILGLLHNVREAYGSLGRKLSNPASLDEVLEACRHFPGDAYRYSEDDILVEDDFTVTHKGIRVRDNKPVAIKNMKDVNYYILTMMQNEISAAVKLGEIGSANIVQLIDCIEGENGGEESGLRLVFELMDGGNLFDFVARYSKKNVRVPTKIAMNIIRGIVAALNVLSLSKIVHRDLTPDKILFSKEGDVKISNFSWSTIIDLEVVRELDPYQQADPLATQNRATYKVGVPFDETVDIWFLGHIVYLLITGNEARKLDDYRYPTNPSRTIRSISTDHTYALFEEGDNNLKDIACKCFYADGSLRIKISKLAGLVQIHKYDKKLTFPQEPAFSRLVKKIFGEGCFLRKCLKKEQSDPNLDDLALEMQQLNI